jgi:transcriptional regulator with XRE-family HTH domain
MKSFGEVLAEARKRRGLTLKSVAVRVLKDDATPMRRQPYLNDIELDHKGPPSDATIRQLAKILGVEAEVLRFYANRPYAGPKGTDPEPGQIVAAYRAFRRELERKPPKKSTAAAVQLAVSVRSRWLKKYGSSARRMRARWVILPELSMYR